MIKKLILAALLLPLSPLVLAGDINPGGDNPGSTTTTLTYLIVDAGTGMDSCLETADWCGVQVAAPLSVPIPGKKGKKAMLTDAQATAFASVACTAAANAESEYAWFFEGGGELNLTRHGNHGAMHHIQLNADLAAGTLTFAAASSTAAAVADASAYALADVSDMNEACMDVDLLDAGLAELCAFWEAGAFADSSATAHAESFADSSALAESGGFGAVAAWNEVFAANIEEYHASVAAAARSFSAVDTSAIADVLAEAYADAYAEAYIEACALINNAEIYEVICGDKFEATALAIASAYASAYAEANASAMAEAAVEVFMPVTYINENGIYDTISFGPDAEWATPAHAEVSCQVHDMPMP